MSTYSLLRITEKDEISQVIITRPEAMNALNSVFFLEFRDYLSKLSSEIRAIIITGEGKAFVAGADISEMVNMNQEQALDFSKMGQGIFMMLQQLEIPVIAAVNGFALGGGCELAMACDIRLASNKAKFGQPEVSLGLIPGYAGTQRMPRLIGLGNALYYLMTGDYMNAEEALRIGLVQKVVEPEALLEEAHSLAKRIISRGPAAVAKVKKVAREGLELSMQAGSELEKNEFSSLFGNEGTEGMKAFLEKRKADWS
ncbi:MAG: enoyl-CoA hydratase/isomerase family protein [Bacteroidales bacterium]|nr:enoyl-CoA hydratase/isomerase family protein [Bacteroidales bacterium]